MERQDSLDGWQTQRLAELLHRGSRMVEQTGQPLVLYRQILEEQGGSYEELVSTLTAGHIIEQVVVSGGMVAPSFYRQRVYPISEYPMAVLSQSRERFEEMVQMLERSID